MISRSVPETENKLMILYALTRVGPCTADELLQFMAEYALTDYFTLQLALYGMVEQGQLQCVQHPFGELLQVTEAGAFTVDEFDRRIPASLREVIDREAEGWRERFVLEQQAPAQAIPTAEGKLLHMQLLQGEGVGLELRICVAADEKAAVFLQRRWREIAYDALQLIQHLLGADQPAEAPPMPDGAAAELLGRDGVRLSLTCGGGDLALVLPDLAAAQWYAHRWQLIGPEVLKAVVELLHLTPVEDG